MAATLGSDWREKYFGKGGVFEGKEALLRMLLSRDADSGVLLGFLPWIMKPAAELHGYGSDLSGYDASGVRVGGTRAAGVLGGLGLDAILNINTGEFSLFASGEAGLMTGAGISAGMEWLGVKRLPANEAYGGASFSHGLFAGFDCSTALEEFWSAPLSMDSNWNEMPGGAGVAVGGGGGFGLYRTISYGYEIYRQTETGGVWRPVPPRPSDILTALAVDWKQSPWPYPWSPRRN